MNEFNTTSLHNPPNSNNIKGILQRSVKLFEETGLKDLARKWDKILNNYQNKNK